MFSNWLTVVLAGAFALGFGGFGLIMLLIYSSALMRASASRNWPSVEGRIDSSHVGRVASSRGGRSSTSNYKPEIKYSYSVKGNSYAGSHIGFGVPILGWQFGAEQVVARYPTGAARTVYYDPQNPAQAVLERKMQNNAAALIVTLACLLVGVGSCVFTTVILYTRFK